MELMCKLMKGYDLFGVYFPYLGREYPLAQSRASQDNFHLRQRIQRPREVVANHRGIIQPVAWWVIKVLQESCRHTLEAASRLDYPNYLIS
jgi:hypothetical protein